VLEEDETLLENPNIIDLGPVLLRVFTTKLRVRACHVQTTPQLTRSLNMTRGSICKAVAHRYFWNVGGIQHVMCADRLSQVLQWIYSVMTAYHSIKFPIVYDDVIVFL
jgi:hypothetical protein